LDELEREIRVRISRRRMIKRVGLATGLAWSAPILSSVRTPAFAQYSVCTGTEACDSSVICGVGDRGFVCLCAPTTEGTPFCRQAQQFCGCAEFAVCTSSADCPQGWACFVGGQPGCCPTNLCLPPCGVRAPGC
jgi:hypothetical protein